MRDIGCESIQFPDRRYVMNSISLHCLIRLLREFRSDALRRDAAGRHKAHKLAKPGEILTA